MATITPEPAPQEPADRGESPRDAKRERLKREDPKRSGPIRNATTYFRESHSWDAGAPQPSEPGAGTEPPLTERLDDVITHGVHLGYKVIEEHLLKGQRTARQLRQSRAEAPEAHGDLDAFVEQAQRLYQDLGTLCFDALETLIRSPALLRGLARAVAPEAAAAPQASAASNPAVQFAVQISARHRTRIDLQLDPAARIETLKVHALHGPGPDAPPLTAIVLRPEPGRGIALVDITIPDRQPPGLYSGIVVDTRTNEPAGTLTVRISALSES